MLGWRQENLADNARQISDLGQELYKRITTCVDHLDKLGKSLDTANHAYNQAVGSLEARVLVSARKFQELGAAPQNEELGKARMIERARRRVADPELVIRD